MRRQILRFPVGPQFREVLEDDHEWLILTDMRLRPLVMNRGHIDGISTTQRSKLYYDLSKQAWFKKHIRVYDLHTHPTWGDLDQLAPSQADMTNFTFERATQRFNKEYGISVAGSGVITKKGILIIKIAEQISKQAIENDDIKNEYSSRVKRELENQNIKSITDIGDDVEGAKVLVKAHKKAFKSLTTETSGISKKTIGRTHRFNMRRRR
jgi:hypothetical protein